MMAPVSTSAATRLEPVGVEACESLSCAAFGALGREDCGVVVLRGASSWGAHEAGEVVVPQSGRGPLRVPISYDRRGAPYAMVPDAVPGAGGGPCADEDASLGLSLADEGDFLACAWARVAPGSSLVGVGVDLAAASDFGEGPSTRRLVRPIFTEREHELAPALFGGDVAMGYAALFGAKEAAFKAMARPLRAWCREHDEELAFEVRHFSAVASGLERGEERDGAAQHAMDAMGVARVGWRASEVAGMALVVACAWAK